MSFNVMMHAFDSASIAPNIHDFTDIDFIDRQGETND